MWEQLSVSSNPHYGLSLNQKMLSVVDNSGLTQLVTFPTRGGSILDLVLSSHSDLVSNIHSREGTSDHSAVSSDN